jgi:predicted RNA-binding Zn-ribbon protein involved in translation (DUF1610 family)
MKTRSMWGAGRFPSTASYRSNGCPRPEGKTVTTLYVFECPNCGERTVVDGAIRDLLVEDGCVVCGRAVPTGAFDRR